MQPRLQIEERAPSISRREWVQAWSTVALNSFGGPAGQIAVMHDEIVTRRRWIGERRFLHALNYCMLLPGPEAQQLATYLGWLLRGPTGGLFAGAIFVLPGFVSIMVLSILFAAHGDVGWVGGLFFGISAAVIAIVANAVLRIGRRVIRNRTMVAIAGAAFLAIFVFEVSFPLVVVAAAGVGLVGARIAPATFAGGSDHASGAPQDGGEHVLVRDDELALAPSTPARAIRVLAIGLALWFGPIVVLAATVGGDSVFVDVGRLFSTAAVLTFGGAYSVLAFISTEAVSFGWLEPDEMVTGLGMAETTPGPLIQVVQFVGFMGPYRDPGALSPMTAGVFGAVLATWVTFVPSFLWIFLGAPFMERLRERPSLTAALSSITAAVVGAVLNLGIWFALFTLFDDVTTHRGLGAVLHRPAVGSLDVAAAVVAGFAALAVFRWRWTTVRVVAAAAVLGIAHQLLLT